MVKKVLEVLEVKPDPVDDVPVIDEKNDDSDAEETVTIQKSKKQRTELQINAFKLVIEKREQNRAIRKEAREKEAELKKIEIEEKIVKKAVSIKKKEIKKQLILDDVSSDDESITEIKKKIVESKKKVVAKAKEVKPEVPKYIFV